MLKESRHCSLLDEMASMLCAQHFNGGLVHQRKTKGMYLFLHKLYPASQLRLHLITLHNTTVPVLLVRGNELCIRFIPALHRSSSSSLAQAEAQMTWMVSPMYSTCTSYQVQNLVQNRWYRYPLYVCMYTTVRRMYLTTHQQFCAQNLYRTVRNCVLRLTPLETLAQKHLLVLSKIKSDLQSCACRLLPS